MEKLKQNMRKKIKGVKADKNESNIIKSEMEIVDMSGLN